MLDELIYVVSEHVYVKAFFKNDKNLLLRISMQNFLDQLPSNSLIRINRSEAVNPNYITCTSKNIITVNGKIFKISSKYK